MLQETGTLMPWGWAVRNAQLDLGGSKGTPAEAAEPGAWPDYEAQYLKNRLSRGGGRFNAVGLD